jgi:hypothetical protein
LGAVIADAPLILGTTRPKWSCPPNTHKHNISICVYIIYWINLFIHLCISTIYNIANIYIILHIYILYIYMHIAAFHMSLHLQSRLFVGEVLLEILHLSGFNSTGDFTNGDPTGCRNTFEKTWKINAIMRTIYICVYIYGICIYILHMVYYIIS